MSSNKRKPGLRVYGNQRKRRPLQWANPQFFDDSADNMVQPLSQQTHLLAPPPPKKRPTSQKEATMPSEPDPTSVNTVMDFTECPRSLAIRYLKAKHNNVEAAVSAIFDKEDIDQLEQETMWDDGMFTTDREGNEQGLHALGTSPAPTRGPSPAPSLGISQPKSRTQEDEDLEAALALSRQDLDMPFQQETGVRLQDGTETGQTFGPATREHYESDRWAMVPTSTVAQEVVPDTDIEHRRNLDHEPRFLKHLPDGDYTPNFITICQAIPAAREAFLLRDNVRAEYGADPEWWRGHPIPMPRIVHTVDGAPVHPDTDARVELITETQRLMAFLDCSARSYATIGGLTQTEAIKSSEANASRSGTLLELFINYWTSAAHAHSQHADDVAHLFTTRVGTNAAEGMRTPELSLVDLTVSTKDGEKVDLSELLDNLLWDTDPDDPKMPDNYIERPAEIIVMRLSHDKPASSQLGVLVPPAIQLDKYLQDNIVATRSVRQQMAEGKRHIQRLEEIERKMMYRPHPTKSTQIEARQLLQYSLGHFSGQHRRDVDKTDSTNSASIADSSPSHYTAIASQLEEVMKRIDDKLGMLAQEKERMRKVIADISKNTFTKPGLEPSSNRYTLRGVATKPNITYVLRPKDDGDEDDDEEMLLRADEESTPANMQWWRIDYEVTGSSSARITKSKTADYDVLRAVELEHNSALLVYASEGASSADLYEPLPLPLQDFVQHDNDNFLAELRAEQARPPAYEYPDVPRPSIERTSMDSTRVEGGDSPPADVDDGIPVSPPAYHDDGFTSHPGFGLGYDVKHVERAEFADPPVAEIKLSPEEDLLGGMSAREGEMVEKAHSPLFPVGGSDTVMGESDSPRAGTGGGGATGDDVEMR